MYDLKEKVALVTGGSEGIGYAIAHKFAEEGAYCVLVARTLEKLRRAVEQLPGKNHFIISADVSDYTQVENAIKKTKNHYGRIDILVNNAGVFHLSPLAATDPLILKRTIETNLLGPLYFYHAIAPIFFDQQSGIVVDVLSQAAFQIFTNDNSYTAAKHEHRATSIMVEQEWNGEIKKKEKVKFPFYRIYPAGVYTKVWDDGTKLKKEIKEGNTFLEPSDVADIVYTMVHEENGTDVYVGMLDGRKMTGVVSKNKIGPL